CVMLAPGFLVDRAGFVHPFHEVDETRVTRVEVALHRAVEDVVGAFVSDRVLRELLGRLPRRRRSHICCRSSAATTASSTGIGWCVNTEGRLVLRKKLHQRVQPGFLRFGAAADQRQRGHRYHQLYTHSDLLWVASEARQRAARRAIGRKMYRGTVLTRDVAC